MSRHIHTVGAGFKPIPTIRVGIGEGAVARSPDIIIAEGLGSCVALCLYDVLQGVGGMAHIMLPHSSECKSRKNNVPLPYLYGDFALDALLNEMEKSGAHRHNVIAKMAGGARMFPVYNGASTSIGEQNIACIRELLKTRLIPLVGADVGGSHGRSVEFHVQSGKLVIMAIGRELREI